MLPQYIFLIGTGLAIIFGTIFMIITGRCEMRFLSEVLFVFTVLAIVGFMLVLFFVVLPSLSLSPRVIKGILLAIADIVVTAVGIMIVRNINRTGV